MRRQAMALTVATVVATVAFAACGGGDDGVPTGDVSKQSYIAQADEICATGDRQINRAGDDYFGPAASWACRRVRSRARSRSRPSSRRP